MTQIVRAALGALGVFALAACSSATLNPPRAPVRPPSEIALGTVDMAVQRVESEVSRAEVAAAVQAELDSAQVCFGWPALWLEGDARRSVFLARFDLMARDWGADVAAESRARMQAFVDWGFLTAEAQARLSPDALEYTLTSEGARHLQGSPYGGATPKFCGNLGRRVLEITAMEWGDFPCGSLHATFTHVADNWPLWASTEDAQQRVEAAWGGRLGEVRTGAVTLARQWYARGHEPRGFGVNGGLRSVCLDAARQVVAGNDLELHVGAPVHEIEVEELTDTASNDTVN